MKKTIQKNYWRVIYAAYKMTMVFNTRSTPNFSDAIYFRKQDVQYRGVLLIILIFVFTALLITF